MPARHVCETEEERKSILEMKIFLPYASRAEHDRTQKTNIRGVVRV